MCGRRRYITSSTTISSSWSVTGIRSCANLSTSYSHFLPLLTMIATFSTYVSCAVLELIIINDHLPFVPQTLVMKQELTASRIFSSIAVFDVIRDYMHMCTFLVNPSCTILEVNGIRLTSVLSNRANHSGQGMNCLGYYARALAKGSRRFRWTESMPF